MPCENVKECSCPKKECKNNAKCCDCVKNHREQGNLPHCLRGMKRG